MDASRREDHLGKSTLTLTRHAQRRLQQRGIPLRAVDLVLRYGVRERSSGATSVFMNRDARSLLAKSEGDGVVRELGHKLDIYLVVGDQGELVTAAYRSRPFKH